MIFADIIRTSPSLWIFGLTDKQIHPLANNSDHICIYFGGLEILIDEDKAVQAIVHTENIIIV